MAKSHWLIVGPGALGQLYAAKLALAGHPVSLWGRSGPITPNAYEYVDLAGHSYHWRSAQVSNAISRILVATKIFQSDQALQAVLDSGLVTHSCPILLMHNGLGAGERITRLSPAQPLLLASSRHGAFKHSATQVQHTGQGLTQLGLVAGHFTQTEKARLCDELELALGEFEWHSTILTPLWQKLVINSVINPITARDQIKNGTLLEEKYQQESETLCQQACYIAQLEGIDLKHKELFKQIKQVAQATAQNTSSMLQDRLQQRATEIDYINGYLLQKAQQHGVAIPAHEKLLKTIQQICPNE